MRTAGTVRAGSGALTRARRPLVAAAAVAAVAVIGTLGAPGIAAAAGWRWTAPAT